MEGTNDVFSEMRPLVPRLDPTELEQWIDIIQAIRHRSSSQRPSIRRLKLQIQSSRQRQLDDEMQGMTTYVTDSLGSSGILVPDILSFVEEDTVELHLSEWSIRLFLIRRIRFHLSRFLYSKECQS